MKYRICSVIITYNNYTVTESIRALLNQTYPLWKIIVIDNSPNNKVVELIEKFKKSLPHIKAKKIAVIKNKINNGASGGYAQGIRLALKEKCDFVWLMDGDSCPKSDILGDLVDVYIKLRDNGYKVGIVAPLPYDPGWALHYYGLIKTKFGYVPADKVGRNKSNNRLIFVDSVIFSGMLISSNVIKKVGPPRGDFLMDWADHEFCYRVRKEGYEIVQVVTSTLEHMIGRTLPITIIKKKLSYSPPWRRYLYYRNRLYTHLYIENDLLATVGYFLLVLQYLSVYLMFFPEKKRHIVAITKGVYDGIFQNISGAVDDIVRKFG